MKWIACGLVTGMKYLGEVEAEDEEKAKDAAFEEFGGEIA